MARYFAALIRHVTMTRALLCTLAAVTWPAFAAEQVFYQTVGPSGEAVFSDEAVTGALPHVVLFDSPSADRVNAARLTTSEQLEIARTLEQSRLERDKLREAVRAELRAAERAAAAERPVYYEPEPRYRNVYPYRDRGFYSGRRDRGYGDRYLDDPIDEPVAEPPRRIKKTLGADR